MGTKHAEWCSIAKRKSLDFQQLVQAAIICLNLYSFQMDAHDCTTPEYIQKKIYSVHEPLVECISKGKAHKRYEFGCKVSVAATSRGGWFVGTQALQGNPYDGHTLKGALEQVQRIAGRDPKQVFVDMGYRGHGYSRDVEVHVDKRHRGRIDRSVWRWMKRRAAIEPGIEHLKREHRMERNRLSGVEDDRVNAILSAEG
jgi:transposase, IS5 family